MSNIEPDPPETPVDPLATLVDNGNWSDLDRELMETFQSQAGNPTLDDDPDAAVEPAAPVEPVEPEAPVGPERIIPVAEDTTLTFGDFTVDRNQAEQQLRWLATLSPQQQAALVAPPTEAVPTGPPAPVGTAAVPDLAVLGEVAPDLPQFLQTIAATQAQQQAQWDAFQADQSRNAADLAAQERTRTQSAIEQADLAFKQAHPELHPDDIQYLARVGHQMQVFPALVQQHRGDIQTAYTELLDTAMWKDPRFRERALQAAVDKHSTQSVEAEQRRDRAAALTGSGGSMPRTPSATPDTRGMSRADLNDAIAAEIASHQTQQ